MYHQKVVDEIDKLLICAKAVGYTPEVEGDEVWLAYCNVDTTADQSMGGNYKVLSTQWDPRTNDAQAMELLRLYINQEFNELVGPKRNAFDVAAILIKLLIQKPDGNYYLDNEAIINAIVAMEGE